MSGAIRLTMIGLLASALGLSLGVGPVSSAGPGPAVPIILPGLADDSSPALHACDPAHPAVGDFTLEQVEPVTAPRLDGQVLTAIVASHCTLPAADLLVEAVVGLQGRGDGALLGAHPEFGVLPAGGRTPIQFLLPAGQPAVTSLTYEVKPYRQLTGPAPALQVASSVLTRTAAASSVALSFVNLGKAAAILPRIAWRTVGGGCTPSPFARMMLIDGNEIPAGETVRGVLDLPAACLGAVEVFAGSDDPPVPTAPPGWSLRGARATYSANGDLHLLALACNNHGVDRSYLFPAFRVLFHGSQDATFDLYDTNYFPAGACRPLIGTFPNAPPGLSFQSLVAVDTGQGFSAPGARSAALIGDGARALAAPRPEAVVREQPGQLPDDCVETFERLKEEAIQANQYTVYRRERLLSDLQDCVHERDYPLFWPLLVQLGFPVGGIARVLLIDGETQPPIVAANTDSPFPDLRTAPRSKAGDVLSLLYNPGPDAVGAGSYTILSIGLNSDGAVSEGMVLTSIPAIPPDGWAIVRVAPGDPAILGVADEPADYRIPGTGRPVHP